MLKTDSMVSEGGMGGLFAVDDALKQKGRPIPSATVEVKCFSPVTVILQTDCSGLTRPERKKSTIAIDIK
jgi:hypothetical protein